MGRKKNIALIAHDQRKMDLQVGAEFNTESLKKQKLFGTGTKGSLIADRLNLTVHRFNSALLLGRGLQIGAAIAEYEIDMMIFFWDPLQAQPHFVDVKALMRIAVLYNIPVANNRISADFIFSSDLMNETYDRFIVDYSKRFTKEFETN